MSSSEIRQREFSSIYNNSHFENKSGNFQIQTKGHTFFSKNASEKNDIIEYFRQDKEEAIGKI